ncbi:SDR family oxidoreductase [Croceicoccus naphthovorans]|uniref:DltE n=1 Tax=Croceicoccus naphthovorans TaxID=1348774 RepID=A0A0G3XKA5_9SPHN|nr:SDR family oxidoreductase [Croceicoccus naphthovorans]AKM10833.1 DltE [Croceicoccus naphthovorans]MBB3989050.1 putative oxidoreductase [Croceicoccus naphthovorans]
MKTTGNTILLTGGGSGIGRELAREWATADNTVIVAGRTASSLAETAEGFDTIHTLTFDVSDAADIARFAKEAVAQFPAINVLVNNAGIMRYEDAGKGRDLADAEATVTTNLLGPIRLTDALIDHLSVQPDAAIVNVTSGLAFVPMPQTATYCATKAALHSYTLSLRKLLEGKVEVIELVPPGVQTDLTPGQATREGYLPLRTYIEQVMEGFTSDPTPEEVLVPSVMPLRTAERDGKVPQMVDMLFDAAKARG